MARAATSRLKVNAPLGSPPTLEWRAVGELLIDPVYQRSIDTGASQSLIRKIAMFWDWGLCQPLAVSRRPDGSFTIVDGQHRREAAKLRSSQVVSLTVDKFYSTRPRLELAACAL